MSTASFQNPPLWDRMGTQLVPSSSHALTLGTPPGGWAPISFGCVAPSLFVGDEDEDSACLLQSGGLPALSSVTADGDEYLPPPA